MNTEHHSPFVSNGRECIVTEIDGHEEERGMALEAWDRRARAVGTWSEITIITR